MLKAMVSAGAPWACVGCSTPRGGAASLSQDRSIRASALAGDSLSNVGAGCSASARTPTACCAAAPRARRGARQTNWGCFNVSRIHRKAVFVGWGDDCYSHNNLGDGPKGHCKKHLIGTGDDVRCLVKHWLLLRHAVDSDRGDARTCHR